MPVANRDGPAEHDLLCSSIALSTPRVRMTNELLLLGWSAILGLVHVFGSALAKRFQEPRGWATGARDQPVPDYTGVAARLSRAQANFLETFPIFAAAVLICHVAGRDSAASGWGAQLYFWGRVVYLPVYAAGVPYLRTLVWVAAVVGLGLVLWACIAPA